MKRGELAQFYRLRYANPLISPCYLHYPVPSLYSSMSTRRFVMERLAMKGVIAEF